jgi:hypothetical protein
VTRAVKVRKIRSVSEARKPKRHPVKQPKSKPKRAHVIKTPTPTPTPPPEVEPGPIAVGDPAGEPVAASAEPPASVGVAPASVIKAGNATHDANVLAAEVTRQNAMAGTPTAATAKAAAARARRFTCLTQP